jgi:hypothetical protein
MRRTWRVNLFEAYQPKWPVGEAHKVATEMIDDFECAGVERAILFGRRVAKAFEFDAPWMEWRRHHGAFVASLPHPSARNLWYNDPANLAAAGKFLGSALEGTQ